MYRRDSHSVAFVLSVAFKNKVQRNWEWLLKLIKGSGYLACSLGKTLKKHVRGGFPVVKPRFWLLNIWIKYLLLF